MNCTARRIGRIAATIAAALLAAPAAAVFFAIPAAAAAAWPAPDGTAEPPAVIQLVQVPVAVPVDDTTAEVIQMEVAAALGATIATIVMAARRRRPTHYGGSGTIDISDTLQSPSPQFG
jgi:hypothetical protein